MIEKKKIELDKTQEVVNRLKELSVSTISVRQFIVMYFDQLRELQLSGRSLKAIYEFVLANGIDVGTYGSFQAVYNRVKRARKTNPVEQTSLEATLEKAEPEKSTKPKKFASAPPAEEKPKEARTEKAPQRSPAVGLRPIFLADGTEVEIDPDTGARLFKIKSNKNKEEQT